MPSSTLLNFRRVDERLITSGQPSEAELAAFAAQGVEVVINLALHDDPNYSLPDEAATVRQLGMGYIHIPVRFDHPTEADFLAFMRAMDAHSSQKLWVHCAANMRVTAFMGLYRVIRLGWTRAPAFELMHSVWSPDAVWSAFIEATLSVHGANGK